MNEELSKVLTELAERTLTGVDAVTEFSAEHIPDVLVQLLWWHGIRSGAFFSLGLLVLLVGVGAVLKTVSALRKDKDWAFDRYEKVEDSMSGLAFCGLMIGGVVAFFGACITVSSLTWLQILLAPKLYILEYAARLAQ